MKINLVILAVLLIVCVQFANTTIIPHLGKPKGKNPMQYQLDLELPPNKRWLEIASKYKTQLRTVVALVEQFLKVVPNQGRMIFGVVSLWSKTLFKYPEMVQEIEGVAKGADVPFGMLMFVNLVYEFTTIKSCSGILVRNSAGQILHGRNLDFPFWNQFSRLTAEIHVYRGNQYLFTQDQIVGTVFTLTGIKPGKFSINEDTRFNEKISDFLDVLKNVVINNYIPSTWLIRKVLEEEDTWEGAVKRLNETNITAPIYYIVGGLKGDEGCVIERNPVGAHGYYQLNETTWFLVQSNYDRDQPDPVLDERRVPVERRLKNMGSNMNIQDLFDSINSQWPTLNIASVLTMTAVASTGYHNFTSWYGITKPDEEDEFYDY